MKTTIQFIIACISAMAISSCGGEKDLFKFNLNFSQPTVVFADPANHATNVDRNTNVMVKFSNKMDIMKTMNAFSMLSSSGSVSGNFVWDPSQTTMVFTPREPLQDSLMYTIVISIDAEDADGNDLQKEFTSVFYVNNDLTPPQLKSYTPANNSIGIPPDLNNPLDPDPNHHITIAFSEAIDLDTVTVHKGITVSPPFEMTCVPNAIHTIFTLTPTYKLSYGTYTVTVSKTIKDINGNELLNPQFFSFTVGSDFDKPSVVQVSSQSLTLPIIWDENANPNSGIEKGKDITITFNESIDTSDYDAVKNAIVLPDCAFNLDFVDNAGATSIILKFTDDFESDKNYTMKILKSSITDIQGNQLDRDYQYHFKTDGEGTTAPAVDSISDSNGLWDHNAIEFLQLPLPGATYDGITIAFSKAINPETIYIDIVKINGSGSIPYVADFVFNPGPPSSYTFDVAGFAAGNQYKITIKGGKDGLKDIYGNFMKEDYDQYVEF